LWVYLASPFLMPAFTAVLPALLTGVRGDGARVSLDPNWDPSGAWHTVKPLLTHVDVLLPNRAEYEALGAVADLSGVQCVVKDGVEGAFAVGPAGTAHAGALDVTCVDTVGAGDSFDAGYVAAAAYGVADLAERLRWGNACGALSTRAMGGTAAQAAWDELVAVLDDPGRNDDVR